MRPLVSVVTPVKNRPVLVRETLASLCTQTLTRWEALVVDDGSDDDTPEAVAAAAREDPRIRLLLRRTGPGGICVARNQGVRAASAPFVVFLDSDDLLAPGSLAGRLEAAAADGAGDLVVYGCRLFDRRPGDRREHWNIQGGDSLDRFLALDSPWSLAAPLWPRGCLERAGEWHPRATVWNDWDFHLRALARGVRAREIPVVDHYYRAPRPESHSSQALCPRMMPCHLGMLHRAGGELSAHGLLTRRRRELLVGSHLRFAWEFRRRGGVLAAVRVWLGSRRWGRVPTERLFVGLVHLLPVQNRRGRGYPQLVARWPEYAVGSATFLRATSLRADGHGTS